MTEHVPGVLVERHDTGNRFVQNHLWSNLQDVSGSLEVILKMMVYT
jgi:hypothetical protein